jgi:hypothetical protein
MQDERQQDRRLSPHSEAEIHGNVEGEDGSESEDDELKAKDPNGLTLEELADKVEKSPPTRQWAQLHPNDLTRLDEHQKATLGRE